MIKKTITFEDYNDQTVTEDFYFNFTKMELMEQELAIGGFEATIERLKQTQDIKEAYSIFKTIVLAAYGRKSDDGRRFIKSSELTKEFEQSPALSELIIGFLTNPEEGAAFIEGTIPAKLVAEVQAAEALKDEKVKEAVKSVETVELPTSAPVLEESPSSPVIEEPSESKGLSDEELLKKNPKEMSLEELRRAFVLKMRVDNRPNFMA